MFVAKSTRLKELVASLGENGLAKTSLGARISVSTLEKMSAGTYRASPKEFLRQRLCEFFKVTEADLFDFVGAKSGGKAS